MVNAGPDITICLGESGNLNGQIIGSYDEFEWTPPTGLGDPFDLNTSANPGATTLYTLVARGTGNNIIQNPGFESGSINPSTTAFSLVNPNNFALAGGGSYTVGTSATFGNIFGCSAFAGNYAMAWQGAGFGGQNIWCQTVAVNPNTEYKFEFWLMGVNIPFVTSPPTVSVEVNGTSILGAAGGATCAWDNHDATWNSGGATSATICIKNTNPGQSIGVIDEISFRECCVVEDQVLVEVINIQALAQQAGPIKCSNPILTLNGSGSSTGAGYSYLWTTPDGMIISGRTTLNPQISQPGEYTLTVTGPGNCEDEVTIFVEGNVTPPDVRAFTDILTCEDPRGRIFAQSSNPDVTYTWTGPMGFTSFDQSFTTDIPGKYYVRVEDQYDCFGIDSVVLLDDRAIPDLQIEGDTLSCGKDSIDLAALSTSWNLQYSWSGPNGFMSDRQRITVGDTGTYIVMVIDSNDCPRADTFEVIKVDLAFNAFASADTITCIKTEATLRGFSDSTNVTFDWIGPNGFTANGPTAMTGDSGLYILTVTYDSLCSTMDTVRVIKADGLPDVALQGDSITCSKSNALLIGSSNTGLSAAWTGPNGYSSNQDSAQVSSPGWYYYTVIDGNGCSATDSVFVPDLTTPPSVTLSSDTITCLQDSVAVIAMGEVTGSTINWTTPSGPVNNNTMIAAGIPGLYIIEVTNEYGCTGRDTLEVIEDRAPPVVSLFSDTITCNQRTIRIETSTIDSITSSWSGPMGFTSNDQDPMISVPGMYNLIATGINGCDTTLTIEVVADTIAPTISLESDTLDCQTPEVSIDPGLMEAGSYSWSGPSGFSSQDPNIVVRDSGTYFLTFTAQNGCESTAQVDIVQTEDTPDVQAQGDTITCVKDSALIIGSSSTPGVLLSWSGPNGYTSANGSNIVRDSGTYTFTVITMAGCTSSVDIDVILDTAPPDILSVSSDGIPCDSMFTTIRVDADSSAISYDWVGPGSYTSNQQNPRVSDIGWYTVTVTGENGCSSIDSIFVVAQDVLPDVQASSDTLTCVLTSARLIANSNTPNVTFEWTGPGGFTSMDTVANTGTSGIYTLTVRDENGCTSSLLIEVPVDSTTAESMVTTEPVRCESVAGSISTLTEPPTSNVSWKGPGGQNGSGSDVSSSITGTYTFVTTHPKTGCVDSFQVDLVQSADTILDADILVRDIGCADSLGSIEVLMVNGGQGPFSYQLNSGTPQDQPLFSDLSGGQYDITVYDQYGCPFTTVREIDQAITYSFSLPPDQTIKKGESTTITVNTDALVSDIDSIVWTPDSGLSCNNCLTSTATPAATTTYTVTMIDMNGCDYEDQITITVEDNTNVYIPNAFSPNGDNLNDIFYIHGPESGVVNSLRIFDRWGEQVFLSTNGTTGDPSHGWNGTFNGERAAGGVYVYLAEITINGVSETRQGGITVID